MLHPNKKEMQFTHPSIKMTTLHYFRSVIEGGVNVWSPAKRVFFVPVVLDREVHAIRVVYANILVARKARHTLADHHKQ